METKNSGAVLVVDDEDKLRHLSAAMLETLGFTVFLAQDGVEAVELFRRLAKEIRFVLCDVVMPRMDGWETLTALRKLAPNLPVILASGCLQAPAMGRDYSEQPQVFLSKPYRREQLCEAIRQALV